MAEVGNGTKSSGIAAVCPYLLVPGASWRAARPLREHRCMAVSPIDAPSLETQRSLCLAAYHDLPAFRGCDRRSTRDAG